MREDGIMTGEKREFGRSEIDKVGENLYESE
jgi:hypothetical protein